MYSPLQMVADLPENYRRFPDALYFIKDFGIDWDERNCLEAEPREYITVTRSEKGTEKWFMGNNNGEVSRISKVCFGFFKNNKKYIITIYCEVKYAHYKTSPQAYKSRKVIINNE